jgi:hypothetical protein
MRFRFLILPFLAASILAATVPAFSQAVPAYQRNTLDLSIGAGASSYDVDWGHGRMYGITVWADWYPQSMPKALHGLGVEAEARDISFDRHLPPQFNLRQDTAGAGPIFAWRHFRYFHPYAKYLISYGRYDFSPTPTGSHASLALWAPGAGFEIRIFRPIWLRGDYEYQTWQKLFGKTPNPQGITAGIAYNFAYPSANKR